MPRDLGDVLDFFLPETDPASSERPGAPVSVVKQPTSRARPAALPVLALPMDSGDVLRAALAWNLAVEIARLGGHATLVTRPDPSAALVWPEPGRGPLGAELVQPGVDDLDGLLSRANEAASLRGAEATEGGLVLLCAPLSWLRRANGLEASLRWSLLFSRTEPRELLETYALIKALLRRPDPPRVGLCIHAARSVADARRAFEKIAAVSHRHLGRSPVSYGLLVDDLHVYRAIVARRPIGLEHPQSPAARALRDVAELLLTDARNESLG